MDCSTTSHMDPSLWNTGSKASHPLERFWAERFLDTPGSAKRGKATVRKFSF
jgi:hypothetical protein